MTIHEFAGRYALSAHDIRAYESMGLLRPPLSQRGAVYGDRECLRLEVILRAEQLGITHQELKAIIENMMRINAPRN